MLIFPYLWREEGEEEGGDQSWAQCNLLWPRGTPSSPSWSSNLSSDQNIIILVTTLPCHERPHPPSLPSLSVHRKANQPGEPSGEERIDWEISQLLQHTTELNNNSIRTNKIILKGSNYIVKEGELGLVQHMNEVFFICFCLSGV